MSCAVHWAENGIIEYYPCGTEFCHITAHAMEPACSVCACSDDCEENCKEWGWLTPLFDAWEDRCYKLVLGEDDDNHYSDGEVEQLLEDAGQYPYRDMITETNAAVTAILAEHPEAGLQHVPVNWLDGNVSQDWRYNEGEE